MILNEQKHIITEGYIFLKIYASNPI